MSSSLHFVVNYYQGIKRLILLSILQMPIGVNGIFQFKVNNFKLLRVLSAIFFFRRIILCAVTQNTENIIYLVCYHALN